MARHMNPKLRFLGILVVVVAVFGGLYLYSQKQGKNQSFESVINTIAPKGRQAGSILDKGKQEKDAPTHQTQDDVPIIKVGVVTWGGYIGGQYFNEGFKASTKSRFYKEYGIEVEFIILDDFEASRNAWKAGEVDLLWVTADAFPTETQALIDGGYDPRIVFQADWSRGGDAIVTNHSINSVRDLKGKKVAVALGTPSHSFLLLMLQADELEYTDIIVVGVKSAVDAASSFKNGAVEAAVVWSPDDQDCLRTVTGSKILKSSKEAPFIIADCFFAKEEFIGQHQKELTGLVEGWLKGAAEINSNQEAKEKAVKILAEGLNIDVELACKSIDNVRLTTFGDNINFFNLNGDYKGVKGEDLYTKMGRLYCAINMASTQLPVWRQVTNLSILRAIHLEGPEHMAEGEVKFSKPEKKEETAPAFASKALSVSFATNSAELDENAKALIKIQFGDVAKFFAASRVRVEGNTDCTGSEEINQKLSRARAEVVANFLVTEYGFDKNRFVVVGNGSSKPIASNDTADGRAKNRRTDFELLN